MASSREGEVEDEGGEGKGEGAEEARGGDDEETRKGGEREREEEEEGGAQEKEDHEGEMMLKCLLFMVTKSNSQRLYLSYCTCYFLHARRL